MMTKRSRRDFLKNAFAGLVGAALAGVAKKDEIGDEWGVIVDGRDVVTQPFGEGDRFVDELWVFPLDEVDLNADPWDDLPDGDITVEIWKGQLTPRPALDDGEQHFFVWRWDQLGNSYSIDEHPVYWPTKIEQRMIDNIRDLYGHLMDTPEGTMTSWVTANTKFEKDGYDPDWERWLG